MWSHAQESIASKAAPLIAVGLLCSSVFAEAILVPPPFVGNQLEHLVNNGNFVFKGRFGVWNRATQKTEDIHLDFKGKQSYTYALLRLSPKWDKVLGYRTKSDGRHYAFIADRASGEITDLPSLLFEAAIGFPNDIDASNQTIVGSSHITLEAYSDRIPLVWHYNANEKQWVTQALPSLSGQAGIALKISQDGSTIVGSALERGPHSERATIWSKGAEGRWHITQLSPAPGVRIVVA